MRIAVLDNTNTVCCFMDNTCTQNLNYTDDELHRYLKGNATTFNFKVYKNIRDTQYLVPGNHLTFRYQNRDYYQTIIKTSEDREIVNVETISTSLDFINQISGRVLYTGGTSQPIEFFINKIPYNKNLTTIGINESTITRSYQVQNEEEPSSETILQKFYRLSDIFDVELDFKPILNSNYTLDHIVIDIYHKHDDTHQGMGSDHSGNISIRYGKAIENITKTVDISECFTLLHAYGKDNITFSSLEKYWYTDGTSSSIYYDNKIVLYQTLKGNNYITAELYKNDYLSSKYLDDNQYISTYWYTDYEDANTLLGEAYKYLNDHAKPKIEYEITGTFIDYILYIGDSVTIIDEAYESDNLNSLFLKTRVSEITESFSDPNKYTIKFDDFKEFKSQIAKESIVTIDESLLKTQAIMDYNVMLGKLEDPNNER